MPDPVVTVMPTLMEGFAKNRIFIIYFEEMIALKNMMEMYSDALWYHL